MQPLQRYGYPGLVETVGTWSYLSTRASILWTHYANIVSASSYCRGACKFFNVKLLLYTYYLQQCDASFSARLE